MDGEQNNSQLQLSGADSVKLLGGTPVTTVFATIPLCFLVDQTEEHTSRGFEGAVLDGYPAIDFDRLLKHLL